MATDFWFVDATNSIWIGFTTGEVYSYANAVSYPSNKFLIPSQVASGLNFGQLLALGHPTMGLGAFTKQSGPPVSFDAHCPGFGSDAIPGEQGIIF